MLLDADAPAGSRHIAAAAAAVLPGSRHCRVAAARVTAGSRTAVEVCPMSVSNAQPCMSGAITHGAP